jgi:alkyl sulfatase BDS1-like metallo-beta-lactamase superfamily hydrolase
MLFLYVGSVLILLTYTTNAQQLEPSQYTKQKFEEIKKLLPFNDIQDFEDAKRGFIATIESGEILNPNNSVSYSMKVWDFLKDTAAETTNPSL